MDIEKLKKVNQLATTLRNQGLACDRDEAAKLAGQMNLGKDDEGLSNIMQCMPQQADDTVSISQPEAMPHSEIVEEQVQTPQSNGVDEEKMNQVLQCFADQFVKEINCMNEKIKEQENIITQLIDHVNKMNKDMQQNNNTISTTTPEPRAEVQETINVKKEEKDDSPRSGGYESNDVSIEKFFYFGTNK